MEIVSGRPSSLFSILPGVIASRVAIGPNAICLPSRKVVEVPGKDIVMPAWLWQTPLLKRVMARPVRRWLLASPMAPINLRAEFGH